MQLKINGQLQTFIDLKAFRQSNHLPDDFGISTFEKKDYTGLGKIEGAGAVLNDMRANVLARLPQKSANWLDEVDRLEAHFRRELERINSGVGLRNSEIDFAVAGFADVLRAVVYAKIRGQGSTFEQIYQEWVFDSVRVSALIHEYKYEEESWEVQIINFAYGRIGLLIQRKLSPPAYILDGRFACPAQGFMTDLLREIGQAILAP